MKKRSVQLCFTALFVALLAIASWITVPATVPFTMQTFAVYLMLLLLPPVCSLTATAVYLLLGAIGLPVFAGFQGGLGVLFGPPGGFLWGFFGMALIHTIVRPRSSRATLICLIAEALVCFAVGAIWAAMYTAPSWDGLWTSALLTVAPFLLPDALKLFLAWQVARRIRPHCPL